MNIEATSVDNQSHFAGRSVPLRGAAGDHPARAASQRSYSAVAKGDLEAWLKVYAEDAVLEDPVGPSRFDPEGRGHRGHEAIAAIWQLAIEPIEMFTFFIHDSHAHGQHLRQRRHHHHDLPRRRQGRHRPGHWSTSSATTGGSPR
ncbi:MAG: nuclear transport factor 2 family protein [Actinomycetota bacterium]|nr:nuclear transport factor 2 family protein [Actinomycetota bacterium]